ncbi:Rad17 cell cycle checkpoint protein-domain-containing protein [Aspergillus varians]
MDDNEDLIEDDYDSYDELFTQHFTDEKLSQLDNTEFVSASQEQHPIPSSAKSTESQQKSINNTKRFILQSKPSLNTNLPKHIQSREERLPWAQRYTPLTLEELAVHKRKVSDVEQWLKDALAGKAQKNLLVLKGPAGSGKTTTISLLSDKLNFNILEWKPPSASEYAMKDYISLGAQFDGFLSRGHKFGSLDLDGSDSSQTSMEGNTHTPQRRIILIEEFPTMSSRTASALATFRLSVLRYISTNAPSVRTGYDSEAGIPPIVMIVSETFSSSDFSFDNLTVHRLLGREIYNHSSTSIIEFNSIAPTFMFQALVLVLKKSGRQSLAKQSLTQSIIGSISKIGDIRNAIAALEFHCRGSGDQSPWNDHTVKARHTTRTRKKIPCVNSEVPEVLAQREASLGLFHAVGKIVYNKRNSDSGTDNVQFPFSPDYLHDFGRPGVSQVHVNELLDETGTDIQSFICTLHENYVPSCNGPSFTECLDGCIGSLSDSDVLCADRKGHSMSQAGLGTGFIKSGAGVDLLRQEEISYQVAARGLLFALPCPVKRQMSYADNTRRTNNSRKLFFPPATRLVRQFEETQGLLDSWGDTLLGSTVRPSAVPLRSQRQPAYHRSTHENVGDLQSSYYDNPASVVTMVSRSDMILHQLPYMTIILAEGAGLKSLQKITRLVARGLDYNSQRDEEYAYGSSPQGYSASHFGIPKCEHRISCFEPQTPLVSQADHERLILSDDDILDDP